mmetsp:Transcript_13604/g.29404  ORF Transcript_13604/g.29404 Transcript_13604/m.29404 type:complete len:90 (+) Transcript_13604:1-270(+)
MLFRSSYPIVGYQVGEKEVGCNVVEEVGFLPLLLMLVGSIDGSDDDDNDCNTSLLGIKLGSIDGSLEDVGSMEGVEMMIDGDDIIVGVI